MKSSNNIWSSLLGMDKELLRMVKITNANNN